MTSLAVAAEESVRSVIHDYPQIVPVSQDNSIVDYLADQTKPFVGDPKKTFTGLKSR
jgi:hypothetical protein